MKKYRAFISLFIILILPLIIYGLMKLLTVSHYKPIENISEKILNPNGGSDSVFKAIGDFSFLTQTGERLTRDSLAGKIWICNLFYGRCNDICDRMHSTVSQLQSDFQDHPEVRFVSISIDPLHDSLAILQSYANRVEATPHRWYVVSGDTATLPKFLRQELRYTGEVQPDTVEYTLRETSFRLIDWNGHFRGGFYDGLAEDQCVRMAQHLMLLQKEWEEMTAKSAGATQ
jgi:protein SCO1/2